LVQPERPGDRPGERRDLERMGEARAVVVALGGDEDLGLVLQAPERLGVEDPVAIPLERGPKPIRRLRDVAGGGLGPRRPGAERRLARADQTDWRRRPKPPRTPPFPICWACRDLRRAETWSARSPSDLGADSRGGAGLAAARASSARVASPVTRAARSSAALSPSMRSEYAARRGEVARIAARSSGASGVIREAGG